MDRYWSAHRGLYYAVSILGGIFSLFNTSFATTQVYLPTHHASGAFVIDAEHATRVEAGRHGHKWRFAPGVGTLGDGAMEAFPPAGNLRPGPESPRMDFPVRFDRTARYFIWVRGLARDGRNDSIHIGIDGQADRQVTTISGFIPYRQWVWSGGKGASLAIARTGIHTVSVWMHEGGFVIDRIILVPDWNFDPAEVALEESPRGGPFSPTGGSPGDPSPTTVADRYQPSARVDYARVAMNSNTVINVLQNDGGLGDGGLTVKVSIPPKHGGARVRPDHRIVYQPQRDYVGGDQFAYLVTDRDGDSSVATVSLEVACLGCAENVNLTLRWSPSDASVLGYVLHSGETADVMDREIAQLTLKAGGFDAASPSLRLNASRDLQLHDGDDVCFRVKAYDADGYSDYSPAACITI